MGHETIDGTACRDEFKIEDVIKDVIGDLLQIALLYICYNIASLI